MCFFPCCTRVPTDNKFAEQDILCSKQKHSCLLRKGRREKSCTSRGLVADQKWSPEVNMCLEISSRQSHRNSMLSEDANSTGRREEEEAASVCFEASSGRNATRWMDGEFSRGPLLPYILDIYDTRYTSVQCIHVYTVWAHYLHRISASYLDVQSFLRQSGGLFNELLFFETEYNN